ncbi:MAG: transposase [Patescibacteria group bacterium]|jgi:putative transposase
MEKNKKQQLHRPAHLYLEDEIYFITARTLGRHGYFIGERKKILLKSLAIAIKKYGAKIYGWVILDNHYHLLLSFRETNIRNDELNDALRRSEIRPYIFKDEFHRRLAVQFVIPKGVPRLAGFIRYIHRNSSREINKLDGTRGRQVWYQYFDRCVRDEREFYHCLGYIHNNPLKHGLSANTAELREYQFCSYGFWFQKMGRTWSEEILGLSLVQNSLIRPDEEL